MIQINGRFYGTSHGWQWDDAVGFSEEMILQDNHYAMNYRPFSLLLHRQVFILQDVEKCRLQL